MPSFDWKTKYIFTHLAAAYSYCGMDGFYGCTFEDIKASGVWGYIQHIYSLEAPPTAAITLSPKEAKAYESGKEQRTGEFTLKGDHRNYITLKMPEKYLSQWKYKTDRNRKDQWKYHILFQRSQNCNGYMEQR